MCIPSMHAWLELLNLALFVFRLWGLSWQDICTAPESVISIWWRCLPKKNPGAIHFVCLHLGALKTRPTAVPTEDLPKNVFRMASGAYSLQLPNRSSKFSRRGWSSGARAARVWKVGMKGRGVGIVHEGSQQFISQLNPTETTYDDVCI